MRKGKRTYALKKFLLETKQYFVQNLLKIFLTVTITSVVMCVVAYIFASKGVIDSKGIMLALVEKMEDIEISFTGIFKNNMVASGIIAITGVVPFLFIPTFIYAINVGVIGVLLAVMNGIGENPITSLVFGILPHGITELTAIFLSTTIGIKICSNISLLILRKKKLAVVEKEMQYMLVIYIFVVIPLLAISAVIEAYATGWIVEKFLG